MRRLRLPVQVRVTSTDLPVQGLTRTCGVRRYLYVAPPRLAFSTLATALQYIKVYLYGTGPKSKASGYRNSLGRLFVQMLQPGARRGDRPLRAGEPLRFQRFDVRAQRFADKVRRACVMDDRAEARGGAHVGARHACPSVHFGAMVHVVWMIMVVV